MKPKPRQKKLSRQRPKKGACPFCKSKIEPDYRDIESIRKFVTDRAKILSTERSGVCARHQRKLSIAIKRARHLAMLPFAPVIQ